MNYTCIHLRQNFVGCPYYNNHFVHLARFHSLLIMVLVLYQQYLQKIYTRWLRNRCDRQFMQIAVGYANACLCVFITIVSLCANISANQLESFELLASKQCMNMHIAICVTIMCIIIAT